MQHRQLPYPRTQLLYQKLTPAKLLINARPVKNVLGLSGGVPGYCFLGVEHPFSSPPLVSITPSPFRSQGARPWNTDRPTDQLDGALPFKLIDRYARPMTIKNTIKNAIDYFYMGAPAAMVSMKVDPDLRITRMADGLCRISGTHLAKVWKTQR